MSLFLAGRLLRGGVVSEGDLFAALYADVTGAMPLARAVAETSDEAARALARELARADAPLVDVVRPLGSLVEALPLTMCERLLAMPVRLDSRTGTVDVAAVDTRDPHVAAEFSRALDAPVRLVRAPLDAMLAALGDLVRAAPRRSVPPPPSFEDPPGSASTPAHGTRIPSAPPIPLVTRVGDDRTLHEEDRRAFDRRPRTNPGFEAPRPAMFEDDAGDPVIGLYRSKPPPPLEGSSITVVGATAPAVTPELDAVAIAPWLQAIDHATTPGAIVDTLVLGMSVAADQVAVFVVRGDTFQGRAGNDRLDGRHRIRDITIARSTPSVFETAVDVGYYLGALPSTDVHRHVASLLGVRDHEVYVTAATVLGHPVLVLLASGMRDTYASTRWADQLARACAEAFGRVLRGRKQSE